MTNIQKNNNFYGVLLIILDALFATCQYAAVKELSTELTPALVVFLYRVGVVLFVIPWCVRNNFAGFKTKAMHLHITRGVLSSIGMMCFFYGMQFVDLSDATVIGFLEQVLLLVVGVVVFKERITRSKIWVIIFSLLGALIVVYPDLAVFDKGKMLPKFFTGSAHNAPDVRILYLIVGVCFLAANRLVIKLLGKTETTQSQIFYTGLVSSIVVAPIALLKWKTLSVLGAPMFWPNGIINFARFDFDQDVIMLALLITVLYFCHSITLFQASRIAELSVIAPFEYTKLIFAGIIGYIFFNELPEDGEEIGYLMIVGSGVYLAASSRIRMVHWLFFRSKNVN